MIILPCTPRRAPPRQPDSDLERLRRELWRGYRYVALWSLGLPLFVGGVGALLILTGYLC